MHMRVLLITVLSTGFRKKLEASAKLKDCKIIGEWVRSIVNHLYWCVASTDAGDQEKIVAKWLSLENHIHNKHSHQNKEFPKCAHKRLTSNQRKKKWFKRRKFYLSPILFQCCNGILIVYADSKPSEKVCELLSNTKFVNDLHRLSPEHQTSSLESYHSVIIHFAPKYAALSYYGMLSRY